MKTQYIFLLLAFCRISGVAQTTLPPYVPTCGLVAWYPFSNNADDISGNALNGSLNGVSADIDRFGNSNEAYYFFESFISVPTDNLFNTGNELTVTAWVNLSNSNDNQKVIGRTDGSFNTGFILGVENAQIYPELWDNTGTHFTFNTGNINSSEWTHLAITWRSGGYFIAYINGLAIDSIAASSNPMGTNSDDLIIGVSPWSVSPAYFTVDGLIDDIGIWSRALTPQEIKTVYQSITAGISSSEKNETLFISPNPVNTEIEIQSAGGSSSWKLEQIEIYNSLGEKVFQTTNYKLQTTNRIDVRNLKPGIYFLEIKTGEKTEFKKIIKE